MSGLVGQVGARSGVVGVASDTVLQYVSKQLRSGGNYFTGTIQSSVQADPNATGVKVGFPKPFTNGSHVIWRYACSDSNNSDMSYFSDGRVKPWYKDTNNNWNTIDSVVWPNDKNFLLQTALASSSIGSDKEVGFGIVIHSGSGMVRMANNYAFAMIEAFEVKNTTSPL